MTHIISHDVLELDSLLAAATIPDQITHQYQEPQQDLLFSDIEKQMNLNASQLTSSSHFSSTDFKPESHLYKMDQILQSQQLTAQMSQHPPPPPQQQVVYHVTTNIPMAQTSSYDFNINSNLSTRSNSRDRSHGISNYDSSPESNFPYTPIDSLESCTTDSNIGTDLIKSLKSDLFISEGLSDNSLENSKINNNGKFVLSDDILDKQIEQIISAPIDAQIDSIYLTNKQANQLQKNQQLTQPIQQHNQQLQQLDRSHGNNLKRTIDHCSDTGLTNTKKAKTEEAQHSSSIQENKFLKCFSILRTNYLSLCSSYNEVLDKLSDVESENKILLKKIEDKENEKEDWKANKDRLYLEREDMKAMLDGLLHEVTVLRRRERQSRKCSTVGEMMLIKDERD